MKVQKLFFEPLRAMLVFNLMNLGSIAAEAELSRFPDEWIVRGALTDESPEYMHANHSDTEWTVSIEEGRTVARSVRRVGALIEPLPFEVREGKAKEGLAGDRRVLKVDDGYIVAFDAGEFGAGVWWFSPDGKERKLISQRTVNAFLEFQGRPFALTGLAHLTSNAGAVELVKKNWLRNWSLSSIADLDAVPFASAVGLNGSTVIAASDGVFRLSKGDTVQRAYRQKHHWFGVNSIVETPDGRIYIGGRGLVIRLAPQRSSYREEWLLPEVCSKYGDWNDHYRCKD